MELKNQSDYERYIKQDNLGEYYVVLNQFTFHSVISRFLISTSVLLEWKLYCEFVALMVR